MFLILHFVHSKRMKIKKFSIEIIFTLTNLLLKKKKKSLDFAPIRLLIVGRLKMSNHLENLIWIINDRKRKSCHE